MNGKPKEKKKKPNRTIYLAGAVLLLCFCGGIFSANQYAERKAEKQHIHRLEQLCTESDSLLRWSEGLEHDYSTIYQYDPAGIIRLRSAAGACRTDVENDYPEEFFHRYPQSRRYIIQLTEYALTSDFNNENVLQSMTSALREQSPISMLTLDQFYQGLEETLNEKGGDGDADGVAAE